jgi:hypothetical protein
VNVSRALLRLLIVFIPRPTRQVNEDRCVNPVDSNQQSYLFTLRVWPESVSEGQIEWRGKVCFVVNQEEHYFRDWPTLVAILEKMLPLPKPASSS